MGLTANVPISLWKRSSVLGVDFDFLDYRSVFEMIDAWRNQGRHEYICLANPHSVLTCRRDVAMRHAIEEASLTLPDGAGIILGARVLGYPERGRVAGPTLMLNLCDWGQASHYRHFFYGGAPGVAEMLALMLSTRYPNLQVAGTCSPPFRTLTHDEDEAIVQRINAARPDIVWLGLGAPKQEKWMHAHLDRIEAPVMIGVGAAFDFHSGNIPWAPAWIRAIGGEWAYRLLREPRRLWRRNVDSPVFLWRLAVQRLRTRAYPETRTVQVRV